MENVRRNFPGEIVIIDDEINEEESEIYEIREYLLKNRFPVLSYESVPDVTELKEHKIGFIICDWRFSAFTEEMNAKLVIQFLNSVTENMFVPIFICTTLSKDSLEEYLVAEHGCKKYKRNEASCIFIVEKSDIKGDKIFTAINTWMTHNPSVKTMKEWEHVLDVAKEKMLSSMYDETEFWPIILYKSFKDDGEDPSDGIGQFLTRSLVSWVGHTYKFDDYDHIELDQQDIKKILEYERTFYYPEEDRDITSTSIIYTGDIFEHDNKKYINIKRQCDLMRGNNSLYLLSLNKAGKLSDHPIRLSADRSKLCIVGKNYSLGDGELNSINHALDEAFSKTNTMHNGKFLEKVFEVIIPCICDYEVCKIDLRSLSVVSMKDIEDKYKRVARLLEPYINIVTEKFGSYISSKGSMRTPETLLTHRFIYDEKDE